MSTPQTMPFRVDIMEPGFEKPGELRVGSTEKFTKAQVDSLLAGPGTRLEDRDSARRIGKWVCLVCGMKAKTKKDATKCCWPLTPGKPSQYQAISMASRHYEK